MTKAELESKIAALAAEETQAEEEYEVLERIFDEAEKAFIAAKVAYLKAEESYKAARAKLVRTNAARWELEEKRLSHLA